MLKRTKANTHHLAKLIKTSAVVGAVLCLINKSFAAGNLVGISLNYLVPFLVALYSRVAYVIDDKKISKTTPSHQLRISPLICRLELTTCRGRVTESWMNLIFNLRGC